MQFDLTHRPLNKKYRLTDKRHNSTDFRNIATYL